MVLEKPLSETERGEFSDYMNEKFQRLETVSLTEAHAFLKMQERTRKEKEEKRKDEENGKIIRTPSL